MVRAHADFVYVTPMTYKAGGRQFVVIASGGHIFTYPQKIGDWLVAYAHPASE